MVVMTARRTFWVLLLGIGNGVFEYVLGHYNSTKSRIHPYSLHLMPWHVQNRSRNLCLCHSGKIKVGMNSMTVQIRGFFFSVAGIL